MENSTFGLDLYLNALNEERVVERKSENEKIHSATTTTCMLLHCVFQISKSFPLVVDFRGIISKTTIVEFEETKSDLRASGNRAT